MYNARAQETERLIEMLLRRMARLEGRVTQNGQSTAMVWQNNGGGGGGGGSSAFICQSIPAIAAGASGTADVYQRIGGVETLFVTGATIWNSYGGPTTAGRRCTLGSNPDGTYTIFGQSCT